MEGWIGWGHREAVMIKSQSDIVNDKILNNSVAL